MDTQAQNRTTIDRRKQTATSERMLKEALAGFTEGSPNDEAIMAITLRKVLKEMRLEDSTYELIGNGVGRIPQELARERV